ncbi:hypothetical protein [Rhizobium sp. BK212]|nr:hypothetical protein [Rhizobium sp. BK212]
MTACNIVVCPPFTPIARAEGLGVAIAAQDHLNSPKFSRAAA